MTKKLIILLEQWGTLLFLTSSLALNVYLGLRLSTRGEIQTVNPFKIGSTLTTLTGWNATGSRETIKWGSSEKPAIIYAMSYRCVWCKRNDKNLLRFYDSKRSEYRFFGVLTDSTSSSRGQRQELPFVIFSKIKTADGNLLSFTSTPETLVISSSGRIDRVWNGAYDGNLSAEVEHVAGVRLPGLDYSFEE